MTIIELPLYFVIMRFMRNRHPLSFFLSLSFFCLFTGGCGRISDSLVEPAKVLWGSSTRALENARSSAIRKTYQCPYSQCYETVLEIVKKNEWAVFIDDPVKRHIVILGIKGSVNTTEVGIFFSGLSKKNITIEVTSLSTLAKRKVAEILFAALDQIYKIN